QPPAPPPSCARSAPPPPSRRPLPRSARRPSGDPHLIPLRCAPGGCHSPWTPLRPLVGARGDDDTGREHQAVLALRLDEAAPELLLVELGVQATPADQLLVRPPIHHLTPVDDEDRVGRQDGGEAVGDRDGRPAM